MQYKIWNLRIYSSFVGFLQRPSKVKLVLGIKLKICTEYQGNHALTNHLFLVLMSLILKYPPCDVALNGFDQQIAASPAAVHHHGYRSLPWQLHPTQYQQIYSSILSNYAPIDVTLCLY